MTESSFPVLSLVEARILGALVEKERTVPDSYPLTLNSLIMACNQKTSRNPILNVSQSEALEALDSLRSQSLVTETSGGRVLHYAQNIQSVLRIPEQSMILLATLMLRGSQTAGELRTNSERLYRFADISSVESFLRELAERSPDALVMEMARQPGMRENRWVHLLSGMPVVNQPGESPPLNTHSAESAATDDVNELKSDVARLASEVQMLRKIVDKLCAQLGVGSGN